MFNKTNPLPPQDLPRPSWRDVIKVHQAAELFPKMTDAELEVLGKDIAKNGLTSPIAVTAKLSYGWAYQLLDGINRLDAMERVGFQFTLVLEGGKCKINPEPYYFKDGKFFPEAIVVDEAHALDYVISANIHRRHLTAEQKRDLIKVVLKAHPSKSNRQIAKLVGASHPHIAAARAEFEASGDVETVTTSIDTKGRKQPTHKPPAKKKRRDVDDYLAEKKARLAATQDIEASGQVAITPIDAVSPAIAPIVDIPEPADAVASKEQMQALTSELAPFTGDYCARVKQWARTCPDTQHVSAMVRVLKQISVQMQMLAQEIEGRNSDNPSSVTSKITPRALSISSGDGLEIPAFLRRPLNDDARCGILSKANNIKGA